MDKRYLTVEEAAEMLQCHPRMVYDALREGRLKGNKPVGKWLITLVALDEFVTGEAAVAAPVVEEIKATEQVKSKNAERQEERMSLKQLKGRPRR